MSCIPFLLKAIYGTGGKSEHTKQQEEGEKHPRELLPGSPDQRQVACERGWCSLFSTKLAASGIHNSSQFQSDLTFQEECS